MKDRTRSGRRLASQEPEGFGWSVLRGAWLACDDPRTARAPGVRYQAIEAANVFHHGDTLVFHPDGTITKSEPKETP